MKKVSIILPVYNVEQYIKKCLESIQQQTYPNLEVIIVND
ncbi:glycosyltransferase family 2 protein, partial [Streptococcus pneumoniae]|nr:glycosyltransferase family 2 protein [Streptococcus pneumoniae]